MSISRPRFKLALLATSSLIIAGSAAAQEAEPTTVEEVVVTGTRLAGTSSVLAAQPVQVVTAEVLDLQGATEVTDIIDRIPALRSSTSTAEANGGAATLDLRGMGSNRTLTLVNGRRHVAGVPGSAAVDVSSIPSALVERVEVLTGGASAVYGSDAVTGVVNFILKDDFVGTEVELQGGISGDWDGQQMYGAVTHGRDFAGGRGNLAVSIQASKRAAVFYGDRDFSRDNRLANDWANPALYFQASDGVPAAWVGRSILVGSSPRYAGTPQALVDRARSAPPRAYAEYPTWNISSTPGTIGFAPYGWFPDGAYAFLTSADLDGNGANDCTQSGPGRGTPGWVVGCWIKDPVTGQIRPFRDGIFAGTQNNFGGDGAELTFNTQTLYPEEFSLNLNLVGHFEVSDRFRPYVELKAVHSESKVWTPYQTFDDTIPIFLDNPYIPAEIRGIIDAEIAADPSIAGSAMVTLVRDHIDIWDPIDRYERRTYRAVVGADGDLFTGWSYDVSLNYGRTEQASEYPMRLEDRFFAAIDAVDEGEFRTGVANGNITCRINLDPSALPFYSYLTDTANYPGTVAINTFQPGECRPLNLFGLNQNSAEQLAFQNYYASTNSTLEQFVVSAVATGTSEAWFSLPGGPIGFVVGAEYRDESSKYVPDAYEQAGYGFQFADDQPTLGGYDVKEVFAEIGLPLLADLPFAETLTVTGAIRAAEYSTVGSATTWKVDAVWAPIRDIRFRAGVAETIRAPNISELYSPLSSATFRPVDPCDMANISLGSSTREANCRTDLGIAPGAAYTFSDPLTARFLGQAGGNPDLGEETSRSETYGVVLRPRFVPGLTATLDYWNIQIDDAIASVAAQDIVDNCYDAPSLDNPFCALFRRNRTASSPTYLGFEYLLQTQTNFAGLEASGVDFNVGYTLDLPPRWGSLGLNVAGTWLEDRNNYPFPSDPDLPDPEKGELNFPEWSFNTTLSWRVEDFTVSLFSTYSDSQYLVEIEDAEQYTPNSVGSSWVHNASLRWKMDDVSTLIVGVNNLTDEQPFFSLINNPAPAIGRFMYFRLTSSY
ncbi:TonB-dependent receptor domain-containing protein [Brevundimonas sp. VNH65]|uniref:TonB-dependent receptor domain-containing protein n=1 Tax=Brevundimonas sp. VNH65 TaxID=3400917 RepID=UPI003C0F71E1